MSTSSFIHPRYLSNCLIASAEGSDPSTGTTKFSIRGSLVFNHAKTLASAATSSAHAPIVTIGHSLDQSRVRTVSLRIELHLKATVRQCLECGHDRNAAAFAPDYAGAAVL